MDLDQIAARADDAYDRFVAPNVRPADGGKFVALDVETGAYEIDSDSLAAIDRLVAKASRDRRARLAHACREAARVQAAFSAVARQRLIEGVVAPDAGEATIQLLVRGPGGRE